MYIRSLLQNEPNCIRCTGIIYIILQLWFYVFYILIFYALKRFQLVLIILIFVIERSFGIKCKFTWKILLTKYKIYGILTDVIPKKCVFKFWFHTVPIDPSTNPEIFQNSHIWTSLLVCLRVIKCLY